MTHFATEALLLDVDGTLIDSYRLYLESYRRALAPVLGYAPPDAEIVARAPLAERRFLAAWVGEERVDDCHAEMRRQYEALHATHLDGVYDGVREMLAHLRSTGIRIGVVTGKGRAAWEVTARHLDLGSWEVVITEDEVEHPKPHPEGILRALAQMRAEPGRAVYIGDSLGDLAAGRAAGTRVGAALWPKTDAADRAGFLRAIAKHRPDWTFERPADVSLAFAPWC